MFVEILESRQYFANVFASFDSGTGVLTITGTQKADDIVVSQTAGGTIQIDVDKGKVKYKPTGATVANTSLIVIAGEKGDDSITLDETNGALPSTSISGGTGDDTLTGGLGNDTILGDAGDDQLLGKGGSDQLFGGDGNDTLTGGDGDDQAFGEDGNDRIIWNPGDDTDLNEGGDGIDTVEVNGGNGAETFSATPNGTRVRFDRISPAPFSLDIGTSENLVLNANGGDDTFNGSNGLATLITLTVDGGAGNDTINGGDGNDLLLGGDGNDFIDGNRGNDTALLGAGDDTFQWDPGDGSDVVEGQAGADTMLFNGANIAERVDLSANGGRLRFTRDIGNIVMDTNGVENVTFNALGGADLITVNDLTGTDVTAVNLHLGASGGGGDGAVDNVIVTGTGGADSVDVLGAGSSYSVVGLPALVNVTDSEPTDTLTIKTLGGADTISAATLPVDVMMLTVDGGAGNDTILGGAGADKLIGGDDNDFIDGNRGDDLALLGDGNDTFRWDPGDGSDIVEGQAGTDTMLFNGANIAETIDISANGSRVRFTRDIANITMDLNDVENVTFNALGGADAITVGDVSGTDLTKVDLNLAASGGLGDGEIDHVSVNGTSGADSITVLNNAAGITVNGLAAQVNIAGAEPANDQLAINGLGGADTIDASALASGLIQLTLNGGDDVDLIKGSHGSDLINGGRGDDVALMGDGADAFIWNPGDGSDVVEGQGGTDSMLFNGANIAEKIDVSANGSRVRFTRDIANITMDLNGLEVITFNALGGADTMTVNDVTGTDLTRVNLNLAATGGAGDGAADSVIVNGTESADVIVVSGDANNTGVSGLAARVNITGYENIDRLTVNALGGDDVVTATGLVAGAIPFTADGGKGDDILVGGDNDDILKGGEGDDVLVGGPGNDVLDGGPGNNTLIP
jgi:Ca2+-binding RTX toxin-like protein